MKNEVIGIFKYLYTKYLIIATGENVAYMKNFRKYLNQKLGDVQRHSMASQLPGSLALGITVSGPWELRSKELLKSHISAIPLGPNYLTSMVNAEHLLPF